MTDFVRRQAAALQSVEAGMSALEAAVEAVRNAFNALTDSYEADDALPRPGAFSKEHYTAAATRLDNAFQQLNSLAGTMEGFAAELARRKS